MRGESYAKRFVKAVAVRAAKTFCQAGIGYIGTATMFGELNWLGFLSTAGFSAFVSVLMSVTAGLPEVKMPEIEEVDLDENV